MHCRDQTPHNRARDRWYEGDVSDVVKGNDPSKARAPGSPVSSGGRNYGWPTPRASGVKDVDDFRCPRCCCLLKCFAWQVQLYLNFESPSKFVAWLLSLHGDFNEAFDPEARH